MIFNHKSKEEKEAEKIREEQEKLLKKEQKEEEKQLKMLQDNEKRLAKQQEEELKKLKDMDLSKRGLVPVTDDEQVLYRYNIEEGTLRKRTILSYFVTNYRIVTLTLDVNNNPQIMLESISDFVAINTHRTYEG